MPGIRLSTYEFIEKSKKLYGDKYDYTNTQYTTSRNSVSIKCNDCNMDFIQTAGSHLAGKGCRKCGIKKLKLSLCEFIEKANKVHNYKYNYSEYEYKGYHIAGKIQCLHHGYFYQTPQDHFFGSGCQLCGEELNKLKNTKTKEQFILDATTIHGNKYGYNFVNYQSAITNIKIICDKGHEFYQTPQVHLRGHGCNKCGYKISAPETEWLDSLNIPKENRNIGIKIKGKRRINVDGFNPAINTVFNFHGDYYHGNPMKYNSKDFNKTCKVTFGELYNKTMEKEKILRDAGYNVISMWEYNWNLLSKNE